MGTIVLFGASDDLIEVRGDIYDEFGAYDESKPQIVAVSDGHVFEVRYGECWRFAPIARGTAVMSINHGLPDDNDDTPPPGHHPDAPRYSDVVTLEGDDLNWVVIGKECARRRGA